MRTRLKNIRGVLSLLIVIALLFVQPGPGRASSPQDATASLPRLTIVANSDSFLPGLAAAYEKLRAEGYAFDLKLFNGRTIGEEQNLERLKQILPASKLVLLEMVGQDTVKTLRPLLAAEIPGRKILSTRSSEFPDLPAIDASHDTVLRAYFEQGGPENMRRLLLYLASRYLGLTVNEDVAPQTIPDRLIYHPVADQTFTSRRDYLAWYRKSGRYNPGAPWIGLITYDSFYKNNDMAMYGALVEEIERQGGNALLVFAKDRAVAVKEFFMENDRAAIDVLVAATGFNFVFGKPEEGVKLFEKLNVPVLAPVYASDLDRWQKDPAGLAGEVYWQIAMPELDGRIEPILMGGGKSTGFDPATGAELTAKVPLPDRLRRLAARCLAWANLRHKPNADKKVAVIYYNHDAGKDGINASYLNVPASLAALLKALARDGYRVEGDVPDKELLEKMLAQGRNVGSWAPGELAKLVAAGAVTVPVKNYLAWYNTLPKALREQVEKEWGPPPGKIMVYQDKLVIPGLVLGNVFVGPQPMRGWSDSPDKIYHSPSLPPTHQYIAFYFWLRHAFGADAVVHLGTHGTLEWLPGRSVGLGQDDWPDVLLGDLPDIYPYIINNPGEGTQAKRRGYAVIIDHLTPPMIKAELYGELASLRELLQSYREAETKGDTARQKALEKEIRLAVAKANLAPALGLDPAKEPFPRLAAATEAYLEELTAELLPYGLHTLGQPPQGELLDKMVGAMVAYDPQARSGAEESFRESLLATEREMANLLRALRGEYVAPGLARDPVRVPQALPTGANFYSFDPRTVPDKAAWEVGKKAADQLLEQYRAQHGRYPGRVGIVLWAIETMRTQGETVALALRLAGAEPQWDKQGRVTGIRVTPLSELGRPRVDVLITISGLFRDTFTNLVTFLDEALRQIATLEEEPAVNLLKRHFEADRALYERQGIAPAEAQNLALARIFGEAPGAYGTGVADLVEATSAWERPEELAATYLRRMRYAYGAGVFGQEAELAFRQSLMELDATVQVRDSLYGVVDNDDVYQYLGGLTLAARTLSGRPVAPYIANTRQASAPRVETFARFLASEVRTRLLNPTWLEGMLAEGYAGAATLSKHVAHLFGVDATLEAVTDWDWQQVMARTVLDKEVRERLTPYALQAVAAWGLEAARRGMWQADARTITALADVYIENAVKYGVVCCHHTCANLVFNRWVAQYASLPAQELVRFSQALAEATGKNLSLARPMITVGHTAVATAGRGLFRQPPRTTPAAGAASLPAGGRSQAGERQAELTKEKAGTKERKAYELEVAGRSGGTHAAGGVTFWAILGAAAGLAVLLAGYFAARRRF